MDRGFSKPQSKREVRGLLRGLGALFFAIGIISGCSKSSPSAVVTDKASPAVAGQKTNPTWFSGCPGCSVIRTPLTVIRSLGSQSSDSSVKMSFALVVDTGVTSFDFSDAGVVNQYYGRAALLGRWRIAEVAQHNLCGAPAGEYILRPLTPSYMTSGAISGGTYEAVGPVRIVLRLQGSTLTNAVEAIAAGSANNRLSLNTVVETVNDQPCNQNFLGN